jgi:hypothetical protein
MSLLPCSAQPPSRRPPAGLDVSRIATIAGVCGLLIALAACASLPANMGGLPEAAPAPLANPPAFPAVHDMPPPRAAQMLDEDQQERLEKDLIATRERQPNQKQSKQKKPGEGEAGGTRKP